MIFMQLLAFFAFVFSAFSATARAASCTAEEVDALGFSVENINDESLKRLNTTRLCMRKVTMKHISKTDAKYADFLCKKLGAALTKSGLTVPSTGCLKCFSESTRCAVENCKAACLAGDLTAGCVSCFQEHCEKDLHDCIGFTTINPADHKSALAKLAK
ncbi:CD8+ T cell target antigen [Babesia caballi]|uniref:CD8+ T cell target antigen n=1 Tax=Babesia caballi TaxID=5871 RepID=A0AAV4M1V1_BABCB|nr:CD8+ T cell target antigen [Babesia caballi]